MTAEIILVFSIIFGAVILFVTELVSIEKVAFIIMVVLMITGLVTPNEGIMGFANQATVTIIALMILAAGLEETGAVNRIASKIEPILIRDEWMSIGVLMAIVGLVSAVISTTAVVIVFLKVLTDLSEKLPSSISKYLMPMSFAGILGGSCSLMGTSTNLLVNSVAEQYGVASFTLFEFSKIGLVLLLVAIVFMIFVGRFLIPPRRPRNVSNGLNIASYISGICITKDSPLIGKSYRETVLYDDERYEVISIKRGEIDFFPEHPPATIERNDEVIIKSSLEGLQTLQTEQKTEYISIHDNTSGRGLTEENYGMIEAVVQPNSYIVGRSFNTKHLQNWYGAYPIAIRRKDDLTRTDITKATIRPGNILLLKIRKDTVDLLHNSTEFITLRKVRRFTRTNRKQFISLGIIAAVVLMAACQLLPIMVSALVGCTLMFLTDCVKPKRAFLSVNWGIIFLLAGMIPLGTAMKNSGADQLLAQWFLQIVQTDHNFIYLLCFFGFTVSLSSVVSNNATALLIAPVAISLSQKLGLDAKPFLITVMFAANYSFLTPIGYQTNTLIYEPGQYKFKDFFKVGGLLTLIVGVTACCLINYFYM